MTAVSESQDDAMTLLQEAGAVLTGHFQYASGRHGDTYIEKFRLLEKPRVTEALCRQLADHFRPLRPELVVGPTTGGILLAHETAKHLGDSVKAFFAERAEDGGRYLGRGFAVEPGQSVLVVDDVLTTGGSVRDTLAAVIDAGGRPMGVGLVVDRTNGSTSFGELETFACLAVDVASYDPADCEICEAGVELTIT
ncbi:MAG: phosphoribosyltransferase family protein [Chloroflexota bacterium]|nr:phosphoribosyltransferase family protein [Chloroflexota bacterium]MDE2896431.1 phosphoribosyltransferase family protein [Chloroflexota bacterium]